MAELVEYLARRLVDEPDAVRVEESEREGAVVLTLYVAEDDILVPSRFSREIVARIPGAELRVVPDAGHCYFLERADAFNELCLDFLARSSSRKY